MKKTIALLAIFCVAAFAQKGSLTTEEQELKIEVMQDIISIDGKKIAATATVAERDSFFIKELYDALQNKRKIVKNNNAQIHIDQNINYDVFFNIIVTAVVSGYTDISYTSKANGKNHTENIEFENIDFPKKNTKPLDSKTENDYLHLALLIHKDHLEIWARGGSLPKIFYKECKEGKTINLCALYKESEKDSGKIEMSVYNKNDSAYLDGNNKFITKLSDITPGSIVATLSNNSSRKIACGQSSPGVEDICINGKPAISLKPRSVYDELAKNLILIRNVFIHSPDSDKIIFLVDDDVAISTVLKAHQEARAAGFSKFHLGNSDLIILLGLKR
jgi:biopolymer transport protein ExbD